MGSEPNCSNHANCVGIVVGHRDCHEYQVDLNSAAASVMSAGGRGDKLGSLLDFCKKSKLDKKFWDADRI